MSTTRVSNSLDQIRPNVLDLGPKLALAGKKLIWFWACLIDTMKVYFDFF